MKSTLNTTHQTSTSLNSLLCHFFPSNSSFFSHQKSILTTTPRMEIISTQHDSPANSSSSDGCSTTTNKPTQTPPRPVSRSDPPTTFIQADTTSFKQVVQMLTGSSNPTRQPDPTSSKISIPPVKTGPQKKQGFKLYERRNSLKNGLMINPSAPKSSARLHELLSPSILDFPALVLSPVTPLTEDPFNKPSPSEEERVILEKGFYLHPSPRAATPRGTAEPQLLTLFR
ncbi:putative VQ motif-containing protein/13/19/31/33 [Helianthus annuus]|uniref:Putative VQ n=2 Tax=Helianthus annuus TaxID=4232 RepID=A0A251SC89_HELAN|nr:putative VQ motif-containing protein 4/11/13/19/31/33 [Helianthus annuus]KAJ0452969.1 putative VQ motif-containing protein/13/19/31/33 [Helianthus annuus]KAJ0458034.1 putative VQ motif-containing protein/13/19/31/33 [Helianthus annuus]KAJ0474884.1 putative VQ motif-containing protein/13/19/31/33 [Helianthus annuus]KAJ0650440.1 putative VQ motif-containing protein/13/19/31/33 [Helianthus annuus]